MPINECGGNALTKPYEGLRVVTIEQAVAAPLCSCHFAEGGARVIKIERSGAGDFARKYDTVVKGESSYFVWANHGKESLALDIKNPEDAKLLHQILSGADVFVQNLAPGAISRAGFDTGELRSRHPRLITCDISGYGETGRYRDMKAYDFLVQCESGLVAINGSPEGHGRIGVSICDIGAGMNAVIGIQQALLLRERTGKGSGIKVSLFDTAADWMTVPLLHTTYGGKAPERVGLHHPSIAPYGGYETRDGEILAISVQNEREWARFCNEILENPWLTSDPRFSTGEARVSNRKALDVYINHVFSSSLRQILEDRLKSADIAYGAVNSVETFADHPQLRRRSVTLPDGENAELVAPAIRRSYEPEAASYGRVPGPGEHTQAIRDEFAVPQHDLNRS
ncbi:MAG: CaiB/BaiF CoA-transferase family protein [Marinobacter sp.]|uniref:CaiB/BaiF CoA transferase family protein n=1 Tax=Marinobacter sp. TaxID=50741 RepID=UPI0034A0AB58